MGRRFFIALGSGRYQHLPPEAQLDQVPADITAMTDTFASFGYEHALPGLGGYDGAEQVRRKLDHWSHDVGLNADDVVALYFAGHGLVEDRDRHYLLCWDSDERSPAATALPTEEIVRILCAGELRHLLLVLDTCSGGAGGAEAASIALQTLAYRQSGGSVSTGLWFLASARRKDVADDGAFVTAFRAAVATATERTGQRQQYLDPTDLVKAINESFDRDGRGQRAELASGLVTGLAPFLPNSGYRAGLPPIGTDLEIQRRVADQDLTEHFGPRSRGVEFESEQGLYFSSRVRVLTELVSWLCAEEGDGKGRVVTGSPGCGKSAVLGRIVAMSDSVYRARLDLTGVDQATVVPERCVTAAVHARHKRLEDVVERIAFALGVEADGTAALLQELTRRGRQGPPVVVVVDAVDEAGSDTAADAGGHGEPRRITRELLRPMSEIAGVRLLIGTRHELVKSLGPTMTVLDLDRPRYRADERDVADYVAKILVAAEEPDVRTPYRGRPELARTVAEGVAGRAAGVYLYARTTARTLRSDRDPVDVTRPGWADALPSEIGEAFDDYLSRFGPDEQRVRRMLLSLAFSEGKGLPRGGVWITLASALSGTRCTEEDVTWVLDVAQAYIAEVTDDDQRSVYRLYHKALAEHLRTTARRPAEEIHALIVDALRSAVPLAADHASPDWLAAPPYVRRHLATHAAAASRLADLIEDPGFLLAAESLSLLGAMASIEADRPRRIRSAYEQVAHRMTSDHPLGRRAADLQLSARRCEANELADRVADTGVSMPWTTRWAWWSASGAHRLLSGHTEAIECVAVGDLDGRPIAVTGGLDNTARVWDLATQRQIGDPLRTEGMVSAVAVGELGDYTVALLGGVDGQVRVWDLSAGQELGRPLTGHTNGVLGIAVGTADGKPIALTASGDGTARLWNLTTRTQLGQPLTAHARTVRAVALGQRDGRPIAVTAGDDKRVYVWDIEGLMDGAQPRADGSALSGHADAISALALTEQAGRTVALVGDDGGMLSLWDLHDRRQIGEPVIAHVFFEYTGVTSVAFGAFGGRMVALTCGKQDARLWDLRQGRLRQIGQPLRGHVGLLSGAALMDRGEGTLAVTVGSDATARIWDLTAAQPAAGHALSVKALAFAEIGDRPLAVTGSLDGTARVWDLRTRAEVCPALEGHTGQIFAVALGQVDGQAVAVTGGSDNTVRLWDPLRGTPLGEPLVGHTNTVRCVVLARLAGHPVVVSGSEDGTVRLWDARTGRPLPDALLSGHVGAVTHLAARPVGDGLDIAVTTKLSHAYVWRVPGGRRAMRAGLLAHLNLDGANLREGDAIGVDFHAGRPVVLCARDDNCVRVLDIVTADLVGTPLAGHKSRPLSATLGRVAAQDIVVTVGADDTVRFWDLHSGRQHGEPCHGEVRYQPRLPPAPVILGRLDGLSIIVVGFWQQVRIWNLVESYWMGEPLCGASRDVGHVSLQRLRGVPVMVAGSADGTVRVHDLTDGHQVAPHLTSTAFDYGMAATCVDGTLSVVLSGWQRTEIWNVESRTIRGQRQGRTHCVLQHSVDGHHLVISASQDEDIEAWDLLTRAPWGRPMRGHTSQVRQLRAGSVAGRDVLASASLDGTVRLWDLRSGEPFAEPLTGHHGGAFAVDIGRPGDQDLVMTGARDGALRLYDIEAGEDVDLGLQPFAGAVRAVRLAAFGDRPVAVAADRTLVRVWDLSNGARLAEINIGSGINDIAVTGDGGLCVATDLGIAALQLAALDPRSPESGA